MDKDTRKAMSTTFLWISDLFNQSGIKIPRGKSIMVFAMISKISLSFPFMTSEISHNGGLIVWICVGLLNRSVISITIYAYGNDSSLRKTRSIFFMILTPPVL